MKPEASEIRRRQSLLDRLVSWWHMDGDGEGDEAELLKAAREGHQASRAELHGRVRESVRAYLTRAVGHRAGRTVTLEDLEQDAFLHAFEALPRLDGVDSVEAFRALVLRHARWRNYKEARRNRHFAGESEISRPLAALGDELGPGEPGDVTRNDQAEYLSSQVDRLAEGQAEVVRLRMMGSDFKAIATELAITEEAARKRYARGLAELRALMDGSAP